MPLVPAPDPRAVPLQVIAPAELDGWLERQDAPTRAWVRAAGFEAGPGEVLCLPAPDGTLAAALVGWGAPEARRARALRGWRRPRPRCRRAPTRSPPAGSSSTPDLEALGWLMADYRFDRYRPAKPRGAVLVCPEGVDAARLERIAAAAALAQDLINTPARDMGPEALEAAFVALAERHGAEARVTRGAAALRAANLPMIEAVGAAAAEPPRLLDLAWGRADAPKVTLVGKGVCFDTGGLDIKPAALDGADEEGHGRRRHGDGARRHGDGPRARRPAAAAGAGGRERDLRRRRCGPATSCRAARG